METDFMLAHRSTTHAPAIPANEPNCAERKMEITVLFTGLSSTLQALAKANDLARDLRALIRLVVPQVVPYPLPLTGPPVLLEFNERRFNALAAAQAVETRVEIFLCRDLDILLEAILPEHSTIVIGGRKRWWPTQEELLARRLCRQGHETILVAAPRQGENAHA
ncbi:MAG: hypothetical protein ABL967_07015 [Bryobacteraceae bacterium]